MSFHDTSVETIGKCTKKKFNLENHIYVQLILLYTVETNRKKNNLVKMYKYSQWVHVTQVQKKIG